MTRLMLAIVLMATSTAAFRASAADSVRPLAPAQLLEEADQSTAQPGVSPARRIERSRRGTGSERPPPGPGYRTIDGSDNNLDDSGQGAAGTALRRAMPAAYADGVSALAGPTRKSAREISNLVAAQYEAFTNERNASDYLWQWGQFLDHDIDLTDGTNPPEDADILVPIGDEYFDPTGSGVAFIAFNRSIYATDTGSDSANPRQQLNEITAWIDASNVYGSDDHRANALRTLDGTGRLKTGSDDLLPFNVDGLANAGGPSATLFVAGDVRANEQIGLTAMHTLFMREHNRVADLLRADHPSMSGEEVYQQARRWVGALMQSITYGELLPLLLGEGALGRYEGYDPSVDGSIMNAFSSAFFRFGHSALSPTLLRLNRDGESIVDGDLELRDAFFAPSRLVNEGGIDPILRGLAAQRCETIDIYVIDAVRNFLFGEPGQGGFDLVSLNVQRGRDHGLPAYNDARVEFGLPRIERWEQITTDPQTLARLRQAYASVDDIDAWVGGLAEQLVRGAMVGPLVQRVLIEQFRALRSADRFWFERILPLRDVERIRETRLSDVIRRNTDIGSELPDNVFVVRSGRRSGRR